MTSFAAFYLCANGLIVMALALLYGMRALNVRLRRPLSYRHQLHLAYALLAAAVLVPVVTARSSGSEFLPTAAQIWSAPSMKAANAPIVETQGEVLSLPTIDARLSISTINQAAAAICVIGAMITLVRLLMSIASIRRIVGGAALVARAGSLRILATDEHIVPFSFWRPGLHLVVVPAFLILRPRDLRVALRHEVQHHRSGDTRLVYLSALLRAAFFFNPAIHKLCRNVHDLQEFACDEAISDRRNLAARAYCDCLLWVAQNALRPSFSGACMSMANHGDKSVLSQRIAAILGGPKQHLPRPGVLAFMAAAVLAVIAAGVVLPGTVQDRRVSLPQAQKMAAAARRDSSFPIVVNDQVLDALNELVGTPDGRAFVRDSLVRMRDYQDLVAKQLRAHDLPMELLAVPLVESGYRNIPQGPQLRHGAGLWMFIKPTAQANGLRVGNSLDERMDPALETQAAMRLFADLRNEFGDWNLALLGYNAGSRAVRQGIAESGSRDAFHLAHLGYENESRYLPRVMATIILLKNAHQL